MLFIGNALVLGLTRSALSFLPLLFGRLLGLFLRHFLIVAILICIGFNTLEPELVLREMLHVEISFLGVFGRKLGVFFIGFLLLGRKTNDASAVRHSMICKVVAQLIGIVVATYKKVVLFIEPCTVKYLYVSKINSGVVERGGKTKSIDSFHFVLSL